MTGHDPYYIFNKQVVYELTMMFPILTCLMNRLCWVDTIPTHFNPFKIYDPKSFKIFYILYAYKLY